MAALMFYTTNFFFFFFLAAHRPHLVSHCILLPLSLAAGKKPNEKLCLMRTSVGGLRKHCMGKSNGGAAVEKQDSSLSLSNISLYFLRSLKRKTIVSVILAQVLQHKDCGEITEDAQKTIALPVLFSVFIRCERKQVTAEA